MNWAQYYAYQNRVTSQNTMSRIQFVTGILLISTKQEFVKQCFLLKQLYDIGPRAQFYGSAYPKQRINTYRSREFQAYIKHTG